MQPLQGRKQRKSIAPDEILIGHRKYYCCGSSRWGVLRAS